VVFAIDNRDTLVVSFWPPRMAAMPAFLPCSGLLIGFFAGAAIWPPAPRPGAGLGIWRIPPAQGPPDRRA
jgi:hypothetical protein